ncbi:MAG: hypothetical protein WCD37_03195 [Chloroflexia bacterium]
MSSSHSANSQPKQASAVVAKDQIALYVKYAIRPSEILVWGVGILIGLFVGVSIYGKGYDSLQVLDVFNIFNPPTIIRALHTPVHDAFIRIPPENLPFDESTTTDEALSKAEIFWERGEFSYSIAAITWGLEREPNNLNLLYFRSQCYWFLGNYPAAYKDLNEILALDPNLAEPYRIRGYMHIEEQDFSRAYADINRSINLNSAYLSELFYHRGRIRGALYDFPNAWLDYGAALDLGSKDCTASFERGLIDMEFHRWEDAVINFTICLNFSETNNAARFNRAVSYMELRKWEQAKQDFQLYLQNGGRRQDDALKNLDLLRDR